MKHGRGWEGATLESDVAQCGVQCPMWLPTHQCRVWAFFFFFPWIHAGPARFALTQLRFAPNQADLVRIKPYQPNWVVLAGHRMAEIGLESCRNSRNRLRMRPKHPKSVIPQFYFEYLLLLLCFFLFFFFVCFVFCFLPSSFFVLWTKDI